MIAENLMTEEDERGGRRREDTTAEREEDGTQVPGTSVIFSVIC